MKSENFQVMSDIVPANVFIAAKEKTQLYVVHINEKYARPLDLPFEFASTFFAFSRRKLLAADSRFETHFDRDDFNRSVAELIAFNFDELINKEFASGEGGSRLFLTALACQTNLKHLEKAYDETAMSLSYATEQVYNLEAKVGEQDKALSVIRRANIDLKADLKRVNEESKTLGLEKDELRHQALVAEERASLLQNQLEQLQGASEELRATNRRRLARIHELEKDATAVDKTMDVLRSQADASENKLVTTQQELKGVKKELDAMSKSNHQIASVNNELITEIKLWEEKAYSATDYAFEAHKQLYPQGRWNSFVNAFRLFWRGIWRSIWYKDINLPIERGQHGTI